MHYKKYISILLLSLSTSIYAQKNFSIQEAVNGMTSTLAVKNMKQLQWVAATDIYSHIVTTDSNKVLVLINPKTFKGADTFCTLTTLNNAMQAIGVPVFADFPAVHWIADNSFYVTKDNNTILLKRVEKKIVQAEIISTIDSDAELNDLNEKTFSNAFVKNNNIFFSYKAEKPIQITKDGNENIVYGKPVHRDEFGIDRGLFWSPSGSMLAFYRMDQSMVENYPIVNWKETPPTIKNIKYPFAGRTSHQVTIGIYASKNGSTIYLQTGEPKEQYLTSVTWSPDERYVYVGILNRAQNYLKLNKYASTTGELVQTLFEEKHEKYVEPQKPLYFLNNNPDQFIWWSQRDSFMHLYLYRADGTLLKQITKGAWLVNEIVGYNSKTDELIITATKDGAMNKNSYAVKIATGAMRNLNAINAWHTVTSSSSGEYIIDMFIGKDLPRAIEVNNIVNKKEKRIFTANNTLVGYNMATVKDVKLYTEDSTLLYAKLFLPYNFDSTKKYPTVVYLYNGPHVQLNKNTFPYSNNLWYDYMTQHGYILFVLDGRGSGNRGFAFESVTHGKLGTIEMQDQMIGVTYLKTLPYVNAEKMGIHGWSFGGFMTTTMMLKQPDVFKCGVAGGPVMDWSNYEIMYTERYMKSPQNNAYGYANSLLTDKVKNLKGKLLLIHGTDDDVVVWQHSIKFIKKCVDEGIPIDYFVYPGHPHNVRGKDRVHLMQKITDYFDLYLK